MLGLQIQSLMCLQWDHGDFKSNEKSVTVESDCKISIVHEAVDGTKTILKENLPLIAGEIIDGTKMSKKALISFLEAQIKDAKDQGVLFSLHMKATMMKVSDPIIFGHAVRVSFSDLFAKHADTFEEIGVDVKNGFGDLVSKLDELSSEKEQK